MKGILAGLTIALAASVALAADLPPTPSSVAPSSTAKLSRGVCGGTIVAGNPVYLDASDSSKVKAADTDASAASSKVVGIAIGGCATGQQVAYVTEDTDFTPGVSTTAGTIYVLGGTAGSIAAAADLAQNDYTAFVGVGKSGNKLYVKPFAAGVARP